MHASDIAKDTGFVNAPVHRALLLTVIPAPPACPWAHKI